MTHRDAHHDPLEQALANLSAASSPERATALWRTALDVERSSSSSGAVISRRMPTWVMATGVAALLAIVGIVILLPSLGKARSSAVAMRAPSSPPASEGDRYDFDRRAFDHPVDTTGAPFKSAEEPKTDIAVMSNMVMSQSMGDAGLAQESGAVAERAQNRGTTGGSGPIPSTERAPPGRPASTPEPSRSPAQSLKRAIIRNANMSVRVADVPAAFNLAKSSVIVDTGEFVQDAGISGEGESTRASVTLRVAAARLDAVLDQLRTLGEVRTESVGARDVTDQVVDLEVRLKNERRIEAELLSLLDNRPDAPLKDVLEVRASLSSVRQEIERMIARRDELSRLVALSTVNLTIEHISAGSRPVQAERTLGEELSHSTSRAWRWALDTLVGSIAFIIAVVVGGAIWWAILAIAAFMIWRAVKRRKRKHAAAIAHEPAPNID